MKWQVVLVDTRTRWFALSLSARPPSQPGGTARCAERNHQRLCRRKIGCEFIMNLARMEHCTVSCKRSQLSAKNACVLLIGWILQSHLPGNNQSQTRVGKNQNNFEKPARVVRRIRICPNFSWVRTCVQRSCPLQDACPMGPTHPGKDLSPGAGPLSLQSPDRDRISSMLTKLNYVRILLIHYKLYEHPLCPYSLS